MAVTIGSFSMEKNVLSNANYFHFSCHASRLRAKPLNGCEKYTITNLEPIVILVNA